MRPPRNLRLLVVPVTLVLSGCGYVHLGRLPEPVATVIADETLQQENAGLREEKRILQQELALTRAQGEALRSALQNRAADGDTSQRLVDQLNRTTRDLNMLRESYAALQREKNQTVASSADAILLKAKLGAAEEQLAAALRNYTQLQQDIAQLRGEVHRTRAENVALGEQVRVVTARHERAQAALDQLNRDLLAQQHARIRAEQDAATLRTALRAISPDASALAHQRTGAAADARSLALDNINESAPLSVLASAPLPPAPRQRSAQPAAAKSVVVIDPGSRVRINLDTAPTASANAAAAPLAASSASLTLSPPATPAPESGTSGAEPARASAAENAPREVAANETPAAPVSISSRRSTDEASRRTHIVNGGDTLARISTRYYGTPGRWADILAANRDTLGESNTLVIGRTLRIP